MVYNAMLARRTLTPAGHYRPAHDLRHRTACQRRRDVLAGWIINEGVMVREAGKEPQYILFSDYGFDTYDILIFTSEDTVKNRPDVVERFLRATFAGMQDVIADPQKAAEAVLSYNDQLTPTANWLAWKHRWRCSTHPAANRA
jgi:ABC-type nitrate/sulfonate/bicarbonate transport system substrate-binding protein